MTAICCHREVLSNWQSGYTTVTLHWFISAVPCNAVDEPCFCNLKGGNAECQSLNNTVCEVESGACVCNGGLQNIGGTCAAGPTYTSNGQTVSPFTNIVSRRQFRPVQGGDETSFGIAANGWYLEYSSRKRQVCTVLFVYLIYLYRLC